MHRISQMWSSLRQLWWVIAMHQVEQSHRARQELGGLKIFMIGSLSVWTGLVAKIVSDHIRYVHLNFFISRMLRWINSPLITCIEATPKAILKLMDTEGLTIFHVKSHLQVWNKIKSSWLIVWGSWISCLHSSFIVLICRSIEMPSTYRNLVKANPRRRLVQIVQHRWTSKRKTAMLISF